LTRVRGRFRVRVRVRALEIVLINLRERSVVRNLLIYMPY
jgi:hypothetical protein